MRSPEDLRRVVVNAIPHDYRASSIGYIDTRTYEDGELVKIDRQDYEIPHKLFLGFIDLQGGKNWGHPCIYLIANADSDDVEIKKIPALFPPEMSADRQWTVIFVGASVPSYALKQNQQQAKHKI